MTDRHDFITTWKPLLSVIAANYNNERYIRDCLGSILNQTYRNLEIIVSDDGSTDSSPAIIKEYEKKHPGIVKGIFCPVNRGVARTRHEAVLEANGEYITTLDSDDYYYNREKLAKEMELIRHHQERNKKDILAYSNIVFVSEDKTFLGVQGNPGNIKEGMIGDDIISRSCMIPRDFIMKREAYFEVGGYDFQIPIYEDWDLKIRLAHGYEFYYTGLHGTAYRRHGKGLSAAPAPEHIRWTTHIFNKNLPLTDPARRQTISRKFNRFIESKKTRQ